MELFSVFGRILLKDDGVEDKLKNINKKAQETDSKLSKLGENISKFGKGLTKTGESLVKHVTLPITAATGAVVKLADKASDLYEAQNVVENTFKKSSKAIEAWTNTTATSAGISKTASSQWVGFMGAMLKSSGVTEQAAGDMSKKLVQLTGDMSSFYNIGTSDMWEKIRSGISGETEPLKQLGINMSVANLEAYALSQGITKSYKDMSQAEQTTLRYNYLLSVTKDAQGDFGRTLNDSFANQARVAKLNLETLVTTLGSKFLPVVMQSTKGLNEYLVALNKALNGEDQSDKLGKTINNLANAINKLTPEKIKNLAGIGTALAALGPGIIIFGKLTEATGKFENSLGKGIKNITAFGSKTEECFQKASKGVNTFMKSSAKIPTFLRTLSNDSKIAFGLINSAVKEKLSPLSNLIKSKLRPIGNIITSTFNKMPIGLQVAFDKMGGVVTKTIPGLAPKIGSAFSSVGGTVVKGLSNIVSIGLRMVAPAALIGVLLLGLGVAEKQMGIQLDKIIADITQKGPQLIQSFTAGLLSKLPDLINAGATLLMNFINALTANAPAIITAAVAIITALVNGMTANISRLIPVVLQLIQTIIVTIVNNLPKIIMAGVKIIVALVQGISDNITQIVDVIVKVVTEIINVLAQNAPLLIQAGIQILVAIIQGLSKAIPQLVAALPQIVKAIWDGLKNVDWGSLGMAIIQGIGEGIKAAAGGLWNTVKGIGQDLLTGFKAMFGIHSPSTVFRDEVGKNISLGIAEGISDVDFMQTISDILNYGIDDAKTSAKKVTNAVNDEISKIKDNTAKVVKDLNTQLTQLSGQEEKALRGVKGSRRYAIQDEYNEKKKVIRDEIQLRKEQADKEIEQIKRIGKMSKEELQQELEDKKSFIDSVNSLNDRIKNALKAKYSEEEKSAEDSINKQIKYWEDWKTKSEDAINEVFDEKGKRLKEDQKATEEALQAESDALDSWKDESIRNIDDVSNAKIAALKAQEDALDAQSTAEDRASTHKEYEDKISGLQSQIKYSHDDYNTAQLQKQLQQEQANYQKELNKEALEDKKAALEAQKDAIKADADKQKQNIEDLYDAKKADIKKRIKDEKTYYENQKTLMDNDKKAQLANITQIYNANKTSLDKQLEDLKTFYEKKLSDASLEAEAEKMIIDNNQKEIVALLNSYGEEYKQAGQTLGDKLVEGFEPAIQQIKDMIASITASISAARMSAISGLSSNSNTGVASAVTWHADGGIFDKPSIIGVGDSKYPEAVVPIDKLVDIISRAFGGGAKTPVTNNFNFTHNSPTKITPSEERKQDESFFRKATFQIA